MSSLALAAGGVVAIAGVFAFGSTLSTTSRSLRGAVAGLAGFIPYLYGLYLFAYEGLWSAAELSQFTLSALAASLFFIYFGYRIIYWTWQLSEIAGAVQSGRVILSEDAGDIG